MVIIMKKILTIILMAAVMAASGVTALAAEESAGETLDPITRHGALMFIAGWADADQYLDLDTIEHLYRDVLLFSDLEYEVIPGYRGDEIYYLWARDEGVAITNGVGGNKFAPHRGITAEEWAAMWVRYLYNVEGIDLSQASPEAAWDTAGNSDASVSAWAVPYYRLAVEHGIVRPDAAPKELMYRADLDFAVGGLWAIMFD